MGYYENVPHRIARATDGGNFQILPLDHISKNEDLKTYLVSFVD